MIVDYHMHLRAPDESINHSVGAIERFVEVARSRGIDEIGFTEHVYYFRETAEVWTIPYQSERCLYPLDAYCEAVLEAKRRGLPVKLGLEVDWIPERAERLADLLAPYPWDYLLGSIHFVGAAGIDSRPSLIDEIGVERAWAGYFGELVALARSRLVDALAHPDLIKFFGDRPAKFVYTEIADALAQAGVALEVSSAGLHKPVGDLYPEAGLLESARASEIPITLASDAHVPEAVGRDLNRAVAHACEAGYRTVTVFDARRGRQEPLG